MFLAVEWVFTAWIAQNGLREGSGVLFNHNSRCGPLSWSWINRPARSDDTNDGDFRYDNNSGEDDYKPPDFTAVDDDDDEIFSGRSINTPKEEEIIGATMEAMERTSARQSETTGALKRPPKMSNSDNNSPSSSRWPSPPPRPNRPRAMPGPKLSEGSSWMDRNTQYAAGTGKSFREDFRGTRVFVKGIPEGVSWQTLKDHFRTAGTVVFASVSYNGETGIVQYETTDQAAKAIQIMRDYPLEGVDLFVRADMQENKPDKQLGKKKRGNDSSGVFWQCASPDYATVMDNEKIQSVEAILKSRDQARRRRNFDAADSMRQQLRYDFGIQLDDRSHLWWISTDDDGQRSNGKGQWEQIETEHDDVVDAKRIHTLLNKRDAARRQKDFATADGLLEEALSAPKGEGVSLRVHDESRTWRVWLDQVPRSDRRSKPNDSSDPNMDEHSPISANNDTDEEASYRAKCIALMEQHDPERVQEVMKLLENFPASSVWPRLSQRYL